MILFISGNVDINQAKALADRLNIEIVNKKPEGLCLHLCEEGLSLENGNLSMMGDFNQMLPRVKQAKLPHEMLVKAAKYKGDKENPVAIDATAGMGEDSLLLAAAGYRVKLYEKDPVIAELLRDSIRRAKDIKELEGIIDRMELIQGDSLKDMQLMIENDDESPELIYLDPMFPARSKSGLIKKKFQLLQQLESPCGDGDEMMRIAMALRPRKLIVKRPHKGEYLAGIKPQYSHDGKAIRYDCFVFPV